ncbi:transposase, partial [Bacillus cereus]
KDLAIGFSELDVQKYELLIKTTSRATEIAQQHGREDLIENHNKNLKQYKDIISALKEGNIIFGRQERMKRRRDGTI